jgi:hypothetical protein
MIGRKTGGDTVVIRKERDFITLRFRKKLDEDLKEAVKNGNYPMFKKVKKNQRPEDIAEHT